MKKLFFCTIALGVIMLCLTGCDLLRPQEWSIDRENYTLLYKLGDDIIEEYQVKACELLEGQNLTFKDVITRDEQFSSTECFLHWNKLEEISVKHWSSYEIHQNLYRGEYVYAVGGGFSAVQWKTVTFDFIGEEVYSHGRRELGLPSMHIKKAGETIKEYLDPEEGESQHILLKMDLEIDRFKDGKLLSKLPIIFDIRRTNESVWLDSDDYYIETKAPGEEIVEVYDEIKKEP